MVGSAEENAVVALAARQQGMVSTPQLAAAGFDRRTVARRVASGWLTRVLHGVYRVGPFAGPFGAEMAALLACGPRAALSHGSALPVWGLRDNGGHVVVTIPGGRATCGVRARRAALPAGDVVERYGMRVTTPARTLADLAAATPERELARLVEEAQRLGLPRPASYSPRSSDRGAGMEPAASEPASSMPKSPRSRARRPSDGCSS